MDSKKKTFITVLTLFVAFELIESKGLCEFAKMFSSQGTEKCFQRKLTGGKTERPITKCPPSMIYGNCSCQFSCDDPTGESSCHTQCKESETCVCADGLLKKGDSCVTPSACGCYIKDTDTVISNNGSFIDTTCSKKCICHDDQLICNFDYECSSNATCRVEGGVGQCYCNEGYEGDGEICVRQYKDCYDVYEDNQHETGVYIILPAGWSGSPFKVYCDMTTAGGGWTVFQRRVDGNVDFQRNWTSYKEGFGTLTHEFWLGNDKIHAITNQRNYQLRIDAVNPRGKVIHNQYTTFMISNATDKYRLTLGSKSGNTGGDAMTDNNRKQFSTQDQDNDNNRYHCAQKHRGGWWYRNYIITGTNHCFAWNSGSGVYPYSYCGYSNLNGDYEESGYQGVFFLDTNTGQHCGITWSEMKLR